MIRIAATNPYTAYSGFMASPGSLLSLWMTFTVGTASIFEGYELGRLGHRYFGDSILVFPPTVTLR
jgi:hypothetical protein